MQITFFFLILSISASGATICSSVLEAANYALGPHNELAHTNAVKVDGKTFTYDKLLGVSTSVTFQTEDGEHTVKFYRKSDIGLARYERYALQFLSELGYPVPQIVAGPTQVDISEKDTFLLCRAMGWPEGPRIVNVKTHMQGVAFEDVLKSKRELPPEYSLEKLKNLQTEMASRFKGGEFREWLKKKGIKPEELGFEVISETGDIEQRDFALTLEGWRLFDP